jgi:hypothetical protein
VLPSEAARSEAADYPLRYRRLIGDYFRAMAESQAKDAD